MYKNLKLNIPRSVSYVTETLEKAGYQAYLVGGCVRDLILRREPKDWDITTNAKPEEIIKLFNKTVYENDFGTVIVLVSRETINDDVSDETLINDLGDNNLLIEVTPFRTESKYTDFRHPDEIKFADKIEDDLKRRDFTVNALALDSKGHIVDMFDGIKDIENKVLRTVGEADDRFKEDALRMLRAVRLSVQLDFSVSHETMDSIFRNSGLIKNISLERIRDEFMKIINSPNPAIGMEMLQRLGLLKNIIPELEDGINCEQSGEHIYDVWNHLLHALQHAADKNWSLEVRLAALFHDIGKPRSRRSIDSINNLVTRIDNFSGPRVGSVVFREPQPDHSKSSIRFTKKKYTFYGHEVISAKMAKKIMERLKFPKKEIDLTEKLVRNHMFFSDTEVLTLSAVRRIVTKVGKENIWDLMKVRECDRVGMKKKETPYRLRKYFAMIEEALHDPISVGQLKIDGADLKNNGINPGPRMGYILHALLEEVLEDPKKNEKEYLFDLSKKLDMLTDQELKILGEKGKEKKEELESEEVEKLHKKHGV